MSSVHDGPWELWSTRTRRTTSHASHPPQRTALRHTARHRIAGDLRKNASTIILRVAATVSDGAKQSTSFEDLAIVLREYRAAPPSLKREASIDVAAVCKSLKENGVLRKWGAALEEANVNGGGLTRRPVGFADLRLVGIKSPEAIGRVSVRNDAAFLFSVVGTTSVAAVVLGQLPGDWGFFSSYLVGGISLVVLAIGSVSPGALQFAIDSFSKVFPDYRERVLRHEAAHFLVAHVLGVPVASYSLMLGHEHTDLAEAALEARLIESQLSAQEVDRLSVIAMAGATAEAMHFEEVMGQTADMSDLQRIMQRASTKLGSQQQQNQTRWASYQAAVLLRRYKGEYEALMKAMGDGASVEECVKALESDIPSQT